MKVTDFALKITQQEGLKKATNIAQILEVLKIVNNLTNGELYSLVRKQPDNVSAKKAMASKVVIKGGARSILIKKANQPVSKNNKTLVGKTSAKKK